MPDSSKDDKIIFIEEYGLLIIKNDDLIKEFNISGDRVNEKDLSINMMNGLKEKGNLTTLTQTDIDTLYFFYNNEMDQPVARCHFEKIPLKILFKKIHEDNLTISKLMPMAYEYKKAIDKGLPKPLVVENFISGGYKYNGFLKWIIMALLIILIFLLFAYYLYIKY